MRRLILFFVAAILAWAAAWQLNRPLEEFSFGASLEAFKKLRIAGMKKSGPVATDQYDVLILGDSLMEILFDPTEFDELANSQGRNVQSWNLALRSMLISDFNKIVDSVAERGPFESCIVQVPVLHFSKPTPFYSVDQIWPGYGLSSFINLWNPLSRIDQGLDSPANLWTGPITQKTAPWNKDQRGGLRIFEIEGYDNLHAHLQNPGVRRQLNQAYNQIMGLSTYRFDETSVKKFADEVNRLRNSCKKLNLVWPLFSPELKDRKVGPDPHELERLKRYFKKRTGNEFIEMPWNEENLKFLDSQHIDPQERGDIHAWLLRII